ncbi:MAG: hypothetical protein ACRDP3_21030 [Streptomyces sp.]|uniref:hypothetical protein n=1 Tax=Streptomyces sp. TaxID=1931 RepID=UPI003D6A4116
MRRGGRRGATGVVAAAAALCVVAAVPGQAVGADGGDAPAYGMAEDAKKIKGTASSGDAPDVKPGIYTDSIGRGEKKYYSVSLDAKSSAFLSAVAAPVPGAKVQGIGDGLKINLETVGGDPCDGGTQPGFTSQGAAYPIADYATRVIGAEDECQQAGPYLFSVERVESATSDPTRWPLEIRYMSEPGLKGTAPGAPTDNGADDEPPPPVSGSAKKKAHGGTGFNDAGAVSTGVWKDRVTPGATRFYRVPLDWGQRLNAAVELGSASSPGEYPQSVYNGLGVTTYNPARGAFDDDHFVQYTPDRSAQVVALTPVVDYGNRFADSGYDAPLAGWYYLAVTVSPKVAEYFKGTAPLTLRIDVKGAAKPGPKYDGDAAAAGFGVSAEDKEQAEKGQSAAEAERSGTLELVAYGGIGAGTVLILALALWMLMARRRAATGAGPGAAPVPGQATGQAPGQAPVTQSGTVPFWPQQQGHGYGPPQGQDHGQRPPQGRQ